MPEPWSGTDLLAFIAVVISSTCFLYLGFSWIEGVQRDKRIKALQLHWRERNEERRRQQEAEKDEQKSWEQSDTD